MVFHQRAGCLRLRWKQSFRSPTKDLSTLLERPPCVRPTVETHEGVQGSLAEVSKTESHPLWIFSERKGERGGHFPGMPKKFGVLSQKGLKHCTR